MGRLVLRDPNAGPPDLGSDEEIKGVTRLSLHPDKIKEFEGTKPGGDVKEGALAAWLIEELHSYHEANGVFEDFKRKHPNKLSAWDLNKLLLKLRGKGWGKWKYEDHIAGLKLTTGDFIDHKTLLASYIDTLDVQIWYVSFRKKRLKNCIRYAEQPDYTIEQFKNMHDKLEQEMIATVPQPTALATQAQTMQKEAEKRPDQISELLAKTLAAKEALYAAMNDLGETVHGFKEISDNYSKELHAFRSSVILDLGAAKKEMADVRKFFLEKDHAIEIERLKEFIELCEKFKALKDAGVLDVITDAILKLEGVEGA